MTEWRVERYKMEQAAQDRMDELVKYHGGKNVQCYRAQDEWVIKYRITDNPVVM